MHRGVAKNLTCTDDISWDNDFAKTAIGPGDVLQRKWKIAALDRNDIATR
jgi:hypothetical protein